VKEDYLTDLIGKSVVVETIEMTYTGNLVEVSHQDVHLQSEIGWVVIPIERVTAIRQAE